MKNNQDNDFNDNKILNIDSVTVSRKPTLDNEITNKNYIDDELDKNTILRFNQTLFNYLKVSVGDDTYILTKYDKIQILDTNIIKSPNCDEYLLQSWNIKRNDENINEEIQKFIRSTTTNSPTSDSGATSLPPIGKSFMYKETSSNTLGNKVFVSLERTNIIQITNIPFY